MSDKSVHWHGDKSGKIDPAHSSASGLIGGAGRDLMIEGFGADRLIGNEGDDLMIGGWTALDLDHSS